MVPALALSLAFLLPPETKAPTLFLVAGQTFDAVMTDQNVRRGYIEMMPIYGPQPSTTRIVVTKVLVTAGIAVAMRKLGKHDTETARILGWAVGGMGFLGGGLNLMTAHAGMRR